VIAFVSNQPKRQQRNDNCWRRPLDESSYRRCLITANPVGSPQLGFLLTLAFEA